MFHLTSSSGSEEELKFGWSGALPTFRTATFRSLPLADVQSGKKTCRIFLGPDSGPNGTGTSYDSFKNYLEVFDNERHSCLVVTVHSDIPQYQYLEVWQRITATVTQHVELRKVEPLRSHEKVLQRIRYTGSDGPRAQISSAFSIPLDCLNSLQPHERQQLCHGLRNLELIHLLPPMGSLLGRGDSMNHCQNALEIWQYTPNLRKVILPLDIFDNLALAFQCLRFYDIPVEEIELTFPTNDEVLRHLYPQGGSHYEPTMSCLSPSLGELKRLNAVTIPIPFVTAVFLTHIATLPCLKTLTILPVGLVNPLSNLVEALSAASIRTKQFGCFEKLRYLDLGWCNPLQEYLLNTPETFHARRALRIIFVDTICCGGWLEEPQHTHPSITSRQFSG